MTLLNKTKSNAIFNTYFLIKIFRYTHFTLYIQQKPEGSKTGEKKNENGRNKDKSKRKKKTKSEMSAKIKKKKKEKEKKKVINKRKRNPKSIEQWNRRKKKKKLLVGGEGKFCQKQIFSFLLLFSL